MSIASKADFISILFCYCAGLHLDTTFLAVFKQCVSILEKYQSQKTATRASVNF